jgi:membrane associated rhomboid family serine protease
VIFAIPLYDDNPIQRPPLVTYARIGMCVGAFLWQLGQPARIVALQFGMVPALLFGYRELPEAIAIIPPWATLFTNMFLHGGWLHLSGNMLFYGSLGTMSKICWVAAATSCCTSAAGSRRHWRRRCRRRIRRSR